MLILKLALLGEKREGEVAVLVGLLIEKGCGDLV